MMSQSNKRSNYLKRLERQELNLINRKKTTSSKNKLRKIMMILKEREYKS